MAASTPSNRAAAVTEATFRCGHPRPPENSTPKRVPRCALCTRARTIREQVDRQLERWKLGDDRLKLGEKIARGMV